MFFDPLSAKSVDSAEHPRDLGSAKNKFNKMGLFPEIWDESHFQKQKWDFWTVKFEIDFKV